MQRVTAAALGNGMAVTNQFDPYTGRLSAGNVGSKLAESYQYDALGNVKQRIQQWSGTSFTENFEYDNLNRLHKATIDGFAAQVFEYNEIGNIVSKTGVGSGNYGYPAAGSAQPHAVSSIPGIGSFTYDDNGNMKTGAGRTVTWNTFDMPVTVSKDGVSSSTFYYGPDHQRVKQTRSDGVTIWYAGAMEVEVGSGTTVKTYLPNGLGVEIDKGGTAQLYYTHLDRLGSVVAISDQTGNLTESLAYDSWGKRRAQASPATPDSIDGQTDNKGFTGHEMLDQLDLVHMNGRVYDPLIARFISADPIIQDETHSQSYNRYTYAWNNPTNLTDPTGFVAFTLGNTTIHYDAESVSACPDGKICASDTNGDLHVVEQQITTDSTGRTTSVDYTGGKGKDNSSAGLRHTADQLRNVVKHIEGQLDRNDEAFHNGGGSVAFEMRANAERNHFGGQLMTALARLRMSSPDTSTQQELREKWDEVAMALAARNGNINRPNEVELVRGTNTRGQNTSRGKFRVGALQNMWDNAEVGPNGGRLCPVCKVEMTVPPNMGVPRDWDGGHNPSWTNRFFSPSVTRKEVLDNYNNVGTHLECIHCNRSGGNNDSRFGQ